MSMFRICPKCLKMCGKNAESMRFIEKCPACDISLEGRIWYIDYHVKGERVRELVSPSRKFAEDVLAKRKTQIKEGKFFETNRKEVHTLQEIANDFLEYSRNNKRSYDRDLGIVSTLISFFGDRKLEEITPISIEQFKGKRLDDGRKPGTVNRELAALKCMFNWAIKNEKTSVNPMKKVRMMQENNTRLRYLSREESQKLLEHCTEQIRPIVITALLTGMRRGEILGLKWEDVNPGQGIIALKHTKSGKTRYIPISSELMKVLDRCRSTSDGEHVFCNSDRLPYKYIDSLFQNIVKRSGIKDFHFHDLRHTAASYLVMAGVDLVTVKEILGHATLDMTLRYSHLSPVHKKDAVEKLAVKMVNIWSIRGTDSKDEEIEGSKNTFNNESENKKWRGGRVVDGAGLENRCTLTGTVGSNPTLSASKRINMNIILINRLGKRRRRAYL